MPRRCTYPGCYNECIQNRKKGRLRRNAVSPKVKIQRFTYQYHDSGFGVSIQTAVPNIEPYFRKKIGTLFYVSIGITTFLTGNHGEKKSGTNDGVVCSTFMIIMVSSPKGSMPILTYMQIVYLSLTYFKRADDTRIFENFITHL